MLISLVSHREKARIPAWTDRILRKGSNIKQIAYDSAPLRFSDHRPVYAVFNCVVSIVDEALRQSISETLYKKRMGEVGGSMTNIEDDDSEEDEDLVGYDAIEPGLPPASSDRQKWWLANGQSARVDAVPPNPTNSGMTTVLNPNRPNNPFTPTEEPDWVSIPRSSSRQSLSSLASSAYEVINHSTILSTSGGTPSGRRLPPPFDAGSLPAKVGRMAITDDVLSRSPQQRETPPPPPLPRRQATAPISQAQATSTSLAAPRPVQRTRTAAPPPPPPRSVSVSRQVSPPRAVPPSSQRGPSPPPGKETKGAGAGPPPVAKKPSYLTSTSPVPGSTTDKESPPPLPARSPAPVEQSASTNGTRSASPAPNTQRRPVAPPKPPKPVVGIKQAKGDVGTPPAPPGAVRLPGMSGGGGGVVGVKAAAASAAVAHAKKQPPPQVPAKPQTKEPLHGAATEVDLLDSLDGDGDGGLGGWETLKPQMR